MDFSELKRERERLFKELSVNEIFKKLNAIDALFESYGVKQGQAVRETVKVVNTTIGYPINESLLKQIAYIIRAKSRFMHNSEIRKELLDNNKSLDADKISDTVSQTLSRAKREDDGTGTLASVQANNNRKNTFWGSKEWLEDENTPKKEFMYDKSIISVRSTENVVKI